MTAVKAVAFPLPSPAYRMRVRSKRTGGPFVGTRNLQCKYVVVVSVILLHVFRPLNVTFNAEETTSDAGTMTALFLYEWFENT